MPVFFLVLAFLCEVMHYYDGMKRSYIYWLIFLLIFGLAVVFRLWDLGKRPMHHDEANQAVRAGVLLETGVYQYDPYEHHGPTLYFFSLPYAWFTAGKNFAETTEVTFRIVPAVFGVGILLLSLLIVDGIGWPAVLVSALLAAVSSGMVYYSRYFVQEMLLVFFTFGAIASGWRYYLSKRWGWIVVTGLCLGMMHATKETCVIAYAGMMLAVLISTLWGAGWSLSRCRLKVSYAHVLWGVVVALVVSVTLFSSFFTNPRGVVDSIGTYLTYIDRGAGNTKHIHPFGYYLGILLRYKSGGLIWSEAIIVALAIIGAVMGCIGRGVNGMHRVLVRFLIVYTIFMTLIYSVISYKTPWCMLSFLHGMILLAGIGAAAVYNIIPKMFSRAIWGVLLALSVYQLAEQSCRANFRYYADVRNPYAYVHTVTDFLNLVKRVDDIAGVSTESKSMLIAVVANEYDAWPLPWYLRKFKNVGYWQSADQIPQGLSPAILVASLDTEELLTSLVGDKYQHEYWGLRPEVPLVLYIGKDLWSRFLEGRAGVH